MPGWAFWKVQRCAEQCVAVARGYRSPTILHTNRRLYRHCLCIRRRLAVLPIYNAQRVLIIRW